MKNLWLVFALILGLFLSLGSWNYGQAPSNQDSTKTADDESQSAKSKSKKETDDEPIEIDLFLRVRRNADREPIALETSVTRYIAKNTQGKQVTVDLIGVVHIGEKAYYEALNKRFEAYDALLYELVAPEGTVVPKGGRDEGGLNPVAALQQGMQAMLGLEFQLDHIDYTVDNFVHADMSPEEFLESMKNNDESFLKMAFKAVGQSLAMQNSGELSDFDLMMAMFSSDREKKLRTIMAEQMQNIESGMVIFEGKDGSTIINHRNRKALEIMRQQIDEGKTNLGVFYGAGHLPDMNTRLTKEFGMNRAGQYWLPAWKLK